METNHLLRIVTILIILVKVLVADRTSRKIYEDIQADHFCFRRLNATHQIGCASVRSGNVGVVHIVEKNENIAYITQTGLHPPYIAVLPLGIFTMENMKLLKSSGRVSGVMVFEEKISSGFSPDQSCPNQNFGMYSGNKDYAACKEVKWNPSNPVLGMMFEDWNMPIFLITNETSMDKIRYDCFEKFNKPLNGTPRSWPLCSARLKSMMHAAKDTSTCMRRSSWINNLSPMRYCDPLRGQNIITSLFANDSAEVTASRSVIVVSARLDASSMYDHLSPGAHTTVTGLVTLMGIAHTMANLIEEAKKKEINNKTILFTIFNGETFDYIGSSRMVYDMLQGKFPPQSNSKMPSYSLDHISHFIELSQLVPYEDNIWFHVDPLSTNSSEVNDTVNTLIKNMLEAATIVRTDLKMIEASRDIPLPPASLQSFLKHDKNISGIVIADHSTNFTNMYYNSFYDNAERLGIVNDTAKLYGQLADIVAVVSQTLFKMLTGKYYPGDIKNEDLIKELLDCYVLNASCRLFQETYDPRKAVPEKPRIKPFPLYIGVEQGDHLKQFTAYTERLLAYLSGKHLELRDQTNCTSGEDSMYNYWMAGPNSSGICVQSAVQFTPALSPAFLMEDWKSTEYSTWSESVWEDLSVVIFLQPSTLKEALTLVTGCIISLISLVVVYFVNKRASILFGARNLTGC